MPPEKMKKRALLVVAITTCLSSASAQPSELERLMGFRDLRLGSPISDYPLLQGRHPYPGNHDIAPDFQYQYPVGYNNMVGDCDIINVIVEAYDDRIYQIRVRTEYCESLMEDILNIFGNPRIQTRHSEWRYPQPRYGIRFWTSRNVELRVGYAQYFGDLQSARLGLIDHIDMTYEYLPLRALKARRGEEAARSRSRRTRGDL